MHEGDEYLNECNEGHPEHHTGMDSAWKGVKDGANRVYDPPEGEDNKPTHGHNISKLAPGVVGLQHLQEQHAQDRDAIDGHMRGGQEKAHHRTHNDGDKARGLLLEC